MRDIYAKKGEKREQWDEWEKAMKSPARLSVPEGFLTAFENEAHGRKVGENVPRHFVKDMEGLAVAIVGDAQELQDRETFDIILESYLTPEQWMKTDFEKIIRRGDAALNDPDFDPILLKIIDECGLRKEVVAAFERKSFRKQAEGSKMREIQAVLIKRFRQKYLRNLYDEKISFLLGKIGAYKPLWEGNGPPDQVDPRTQSL